MLECNCSCVCSCVMWLRACTSRKSLASIAGGMLGNPTRLTSFGRHDPPFFARRASSDIDVCVVDDCTGTVMTGADTTSGVVATAVLAATPEVCATTLLLHVRRCAPNCRTFINVLPQAGQTAMILCRMRDIGKKSLACTSALFFKKNPGGKL